jgi:hypothetical protein
LQLLRDVASAFIKAGGHAILQTSRRLAISGAPLPGEVAAVSAQANNFNQSKI